MSAFLDHAGQILDVAAAGESGDLAIVVDGEGAIRMLDPAGWSLAALRTHFGAEALYKVEHRGCTVRVEGWSRGERCLLERPLPARRLCDLLPAA